MQVQDGYYKMDSTTKPNIAFRILKAIQNARIFPKNNYLKFINGIGWIIEAQLEVWLGGIFISRYLWEILGPVDLGLFISSALATVYGAMSLFFSLMHLAKWFNQKYQVSKV